MKHAISIEGLTKTFNGATAVNSLRFEVKKGELFGLVGPDGAGKTTTIRMLTGIMTPTAGNAWVAGHSIVTEPEPLKKKIGYMSQRFGLYEDLTVMENIHFYADLYEVPRRDRPARIERLLGFSNLTPFKDRLAGKLSGGMKQKLGLACSLIHTPEVLFLDEPTNGVDPVSRRDFWKILYELLKEGITILVSTAYLDEAERCARIGLMHRGSILMLEEPAVIKRSLPGGMIEAWSEDSRRAAEIAKAIEGVKSVNVYGNKLHIAVADRSMMDAVKEKLQAAGVSLRGAREISPSLEDVFIAKVENR
ncbi:MAG TPA: ABC transporter ATP-binding protein [Nitrospirota bacterium]